MVKGFPELMLNSLLGYFPRVSVYLRDPSFKDMNIALGYSSKSSRLLSDIVLGALMFL